jgi:hypothetical protein
MAKTSTGRPVGRPKGTRRAIVEMETLSFKAPKELVERVKTYARQRSRPVSELVRDGLAWRLEEGDPLNMRFGTTIDGAVEGENTGNTNIMGVSAESLHSTLLALVAEIRQLHVAVQAIEQRLGEGGSGEFAGNIGITEGDGIRDQAGESEGIAGQASGEKTTPVRSGRAFELNPAKHFLGEICKNLHDHDGQGHSIRQKGGAHECVECKTDRSRAYKARQRAARSQAVSAPSG